MEYLSSVAIVANVRTNTVPHFAKVEFYPRTFDLMLDQRQSQDQQLREAKRILRQIGYETSGVHFAPVPGN